MNPYLIVSSEKLLTSVIRLAGISAMARFIVPESFGHYSVILVVITIAMVLVESGFGGALIRHPQPQEIDYSTTMIVNVVLALFLLFIVWLAAPYVAHYYSSHELTNTLRVAACILFIRALTINITVRLTRERKFAIQSLVNITSLTVSMGLAFWLAVKGYGLWALVIQQIFEAVMVLIGLILFSKAKFKLGFSKSSMLYLIDFGGKTTFASLIKNGYQSIVTLIVSSFFGMAVLGHFAQASRLSNFYSSFITAVVDKVSFADLSREFHGDKKKFIELSLSGLWAVSGIAFLIVALVFSSSDVIIVLLFGEGWGLAGSMLQVISIAGLFLVVEAYFRVLLKSAGLASLILKSETYKFVVGVIIILMGAGFGLNAFLWSVVSVGLVNFLISGYLVAKVTGLNVARQLFYMAPALLGGALAILFMNNKPKLANVNMYIDFFINVMWLTGIYAFVFMFISFFLYMIKRRVS